MAAAVQPSCLWNSQKICYKIFSSTCRPSLYVEGKYLINYCQLLLNLLVILNLLVLPNRDNEEDGADAAPLGRVLMTTEVEASLLGCEGT